MLVQTAQIQCLCFLCFSLPLPLISKLFHFVHCNSFPLPLNSYGTFHFQIESGRSFSHSRCRNTHQIPCKAVHVASYLFRLLVLTLLCYSGADHTMQFPCLLTEQSCSSSSQRISIAMLSFCSSPCRFKSHPLCASPMLIQSHLRCAASSQTKLFLINAYLTNQFQSNPFRLHAYWLISHPSRCCPCCSFA